MVKKKITGPASYFPSIETKYANTIVAVFRQKNGLKGDSSFSLLTKVIFSPSKEWVV